MRRYLATVTPGIATGYWKAMKRPALARSSGAASVMSSPSKLDRAGGDLERGVAHDRVGERGLAGAVGAHQGVDLAAWDLEVEALEDLLVLGADVEVGDLQIWHRSPFRVLGVGSGGGSATERRRRDRSANSTSSARVVPAERSGDAALDAGPQQLRRAGASPSDSCEQSTRPSRSAWKHSIGAIGPSRACTTSSIEISAAGRASR